MTDQENNNNISSNPFAALFGSLADAKQFAAIQKEQLKQQSDELPASPDDSDNSVSESLDEFDYSVAEISRSFRSQQEICEQLNINHMIQRIFLITLDNSDPSLKSGNGIPSRCVYLEEMAVELEDQDWLDMSNVEQALFARLLLQDPGNHLINMTSSTTLNLSADRDAGERHIFCYLYSCFQRAKEEITKVPENLLPFAVQCRNLTVSNTRTVLLTPEIYVDQNIHEQLVDLMLEAIQGARFCRIHSAQGPYQWANVPEDLAGSNSEYLLLIKDSGCCRKSWLLFESISFQPPGDQSTGGQHPSVHGSVPRKDLPDAEELTPALSRNQTLYLVLAWKLFACKCRPHQDLGQSDARNLFPNVCLRCFLSESGCCSPEAMPAILQTQILSAPHL